MLSKLVQRILAVTLCAPILLPISFVEFTKAENKMDWHAGWLYLILALVMVALYLYFIRQSGKKLGMMQVKIKHVKSVDKKVIKYMMIYLLPLIDIVISANITSLPLLLFITPISIFIILYLRAYIYSPLLIVLGYHFYEVTIEDDGIVELLITKQIIIDKKSISPVVQIAEHIILEASHA